MKTGRLANFSQIVQPNQIDLNASELRKRSRKKKRLLLSPAVLSTPPKPVFGGNLSCCGLTFLVIWRLYLTPSHFPYLIQLQFFLLFNLFNNNNHLPFHSVSYFSVSRWDLVYGYDDHFTIDKIHFEKRQRNGRRNVTWLTERFKTFFLFWKGKI